jgi:hypothetical protein
MMPDSSVLLSHLYIGAAGACLSSAAALDPGDQAHSGLVVRVLGILARVLYLLSIVGRATITGPAS